MDGEQEQKLIERQKASLRGSDAKDCCRSGESLVILEHTPDNAVFECTACGCKHYRLIASKRNAIPLNTPANI